MECADAHSSESREPWPKTSLFAQNPAACEVRRRRHSLPSLGLDGRARTLIASPALALLRARPAAASSLPEQAEFLGLASDDAEACAVSTFPLCETLQSKLAESRNWNQGRCLGARHPLDVRFVIR